MSSGISQHKRLAMGSGVGSVSSTARVKMKKGGLVKDKDGDKMACGGSVKVRKGCSCK